MIICINQIITPVNDNHYEIIVIYLYSRYLLKYFLCFLTYYLIYLISCLTILFPILLSSALLFCCCMLVSNANPDLNQNYIGLVYKYIEKDNEWLRSERKGLLLYEPINIQYFRIQ